MANNVGQAWTMWLDCGITCLLNNTFFLSITPLCNHIYTYLLYMGCKAVLIDCGISDRVYIRLNITNVVSIRQG